MHVFQGWSECDSKTPAEYEHDDVEREDGDDDSDVDGGSDDGVGAQKG